MKPNLLFVFFILQSIRLSAFQPPEVPTLEDAVPFAQTITLEELKTIMFVFSSDRFEGRYTGEHGQKKAAQFLKEHHKKNGVLAPLKNEHYFQAIPSSFLPENTKASENVVAFIEGSVKPEEILVISAHYDHLGRNGATIFNGADDNSSGTAAILEIAEAFQQAKKNGYGPKRSVLFLHLTAEEQGLYGSKWYVENPLFPLKNHVTNLNVDMIGRVDDAHLENPNYLYLIGADKLSTELHELSEQTNKTTLNLSLDYRYNRKKDPNRFYYRSDHYNFAKNNIPIIFYFNGVHEDYHRDTDTSEKINYELLKKRVQLIFYTAWNIANRENRLKLDN
jgi:Zn-dependent M28 family amino/carboxypeptidase